ncbi:MAG: CHAP domain-containing protein [Caulobacterales bacterium]
MEYPGRPLRQGSRERDIVATVQDRLISLGYSGGFRQGVFDAAVRSAIELFQATNVDANGLPLTVDGVLGPHSWSVLFGTTLSIEDEVNDPFLGAILSVARSQIGVREAPGAPNRGPEVDAYIRRSGLDPENADPQEGYAWCASFVYWCMDEAAKRLGRSNPSPRTAGVLRHWRETPGRKRRKLGVEFGSRPLRPGSLFVMDFGEGKGHIGFVERHIGRRLITIEGNTNTEGSRQGLGVFRLSRRTVGDSKMMGYIDYGT